MLKRFRLVAFLEGLSFLILLGIAMPLKHKFGMPMPVKIVGWCHGILFMAYIALLSSVSTELKWSLRTKILGLFAGVVPFGTFLFDRKIKSANSNG